MRKLSVVMTTTLLPETHYSVQLLSAMQSIGDGWKIGVYADKKRENQKTNLREIELVWSQNSLFGIEILFRVLRDKPQVVHLQHELNMYGGKKNAWLFPVLLLALKMIGVITVVTVHAVVAQSQLDNRFTPDFIGTIGRFPLAALMARTGLAWIFGGICLWADQIIVHTPSLATTLVADYHCRPSQVHVLPHGVPETPLSNGITPDAIWVDQLKTHFYFLAFGYVAPRKGIETLMTSYSTLSPQERPKLVLAGKVRNVAYLNELLSLADKLGISDEIIITDYITIDEMDWLLRNALAMTFTYRYSFSASGPLAFASLYSVPVIAPAIGTFLDDLIHKVDALLYMPDKPNELTECMQLYVNDSQLRKSVGHSLYLKGRQRLWPYIAEETLRIYDNAYRSKQQK